MALTETSHEWVLSRPGNETMRGHYNNMVLHIILCIQCQEDGMWHRAMWHYGRAKWMAGRLEGIAMIRHAALTDFYAPARRDALAHHAVNGFAKELPACWRKNEDGQGSGEHQ